MGDQCGIFSLTLIGAFSFHKRKISHTQLFDSPLLYKFGITVEFHMW